MVRQTAARPAGTDTDGHKNRHRAGCRIGRRERTRGVAPRHDELAVRYGTAVRLALIRQPP
ncbi:hypothetical protein [Streptomyces sp. NPDC052701]|uniref:hypothetical protein n=1 Tax=Streptomyces sp. NPDC052701 TaxID=3155533 RepID=UPI00343B0CC1